MLRTRVRPLHDCWLVQADVYSFGLILWEMLSLRRPFEGLNRKEFVQSVIKGGRRPPLQQDWSPPLKELLTRCWNENMDARPREYNFVIQDQVYCDSMRLSQQNFVALGY